MKSKIVALFLLLLSPVAFAEEIPVKDYQGKTTDEGFDWVMPPEPNRRAASQNAASSEADQKAVLEQLQKIQQNRKQEAELLNQLLKE